MDMRYRVMTLCLVALCSTPLFAQSGEIGVFLSMSQVGDTTEEGAALAFDNGRGFGASLNTYFGALSLELAATALTQEGSISFDDIDDIDEVDFGDMDIIPITGTLQFHFLKGATVSPYIGAGLAYILADDVEVPDFEGIEIGNVEIADELTWVAQAGIDFNFSPKFGIVIDGKYLAYTPEARSAIEDGSDDDAFDLDLNPLVFSGGVKFRW